MLIASSERLLLSCSSIGHVKIDAQGDRVWNPALANLVNISHTFQELFANINCNDMYVFWSTETQFLLDFFLEPWRID